MRFILMDHLDGNLNGLLMFDLHSEIELKSHCHVVKKKKKKLMKIHKLSNYLALHLIHFIT